MSLSSCFPADSAGCVSSISSVRVSPAERLAGKELVARARSGGERIKLTPNRPTRTLKNLLQEAGMPQWQRDRLPLLACDGDVLWVAQLGVDCRFAAAADEPGVLPTWLPG